MNKFMIISQQFQYFNQLYILLFVSVLLLCFVLDDLDLSHRQKRMKEDRRMSE